MNCYETRSHACIDMLSDYELKPLHLLKRGTTVTAADVIPSERYCVRYYADDKIEATPGVTAGGRIYVFDDRIAIYYTDSVGFTVYSVRDAYGNIPQIPTSFKTTDISPLAYECSHVSELARSRPTGYVATSNGAVFQFPQCEFRGFPSFERAVLSGKAAIAFYGSNITVGPMCYAPLTARGSLALAMNAYAKDTYGSVDKYGIVMADNTQAKSALENIRKGLKVATGWCRNYALPESDGVHVANSLQLLGLQRSTEAMPDELVLASAIGDVANDWDGLDQIYSGWFLNKLLVFSVPVLQAVNDAQLAGFNKEVENEMAKMKANVSAGARQQVASVIDDLKSALEEYSEQVGYTVTTWSDLVPGGVANLPIPSLAGTSDSFQDQLRLVSRIVSENERRDENGELVLVNGLTVQEVQVDKRKLESCLASLTSSLNSVKDGLASAESDLKQDIQYPPTYTDDLEETLNLLFFKKHYDRNEHIIPSRDAKSRSSEFDILSYWPIFDQNGITGWTENREASSYEQLPAVYNLKVKSVSAGVSPTARITFNVRFHPSWFCFRDHCNEVEHVEKEIIAQTVADSLGLKVSNVIVRKIGIDPVFKRIVQPINEKLGGMKTWKFWNVLYGTVQKWGWCDPDMQYRYAGSHYKLYGADVPVAETDGERRFSWAAEWMPPRNYLVEVAVQVGDVSFVGRRVGSSTYASISRAASKLFAEWLTNRVRELGLSDVVPLCNGTAGPQVASLLNKFGGLTFDADSVDSIIATLRECNSIANDALLEGGADFYHGNVNALIQELEALKKEVSSQVWFVENLSSLNTESAEDVALMPFYFRYC